MANKWCYQFHRIPDLSVALLVVQLLGEVDEGREGEDGHGHEDEQQPELLVGLLQRVEEGLEPREVTHELVHAQDPHHLDQPNDLPSLADYSKVLTEQCQLSALSNNFKYLNTDITSKPSNSRDK